MRLTNIKQIIRSLIRRKFYTTINILGLGIGLGCAILMATYIIHEFSYDRHYKHASQLFRVVDGKNCNTFYVMGDAFCKDIPEIQNVCRIFHVGDVRIKKNKEFAQENTIFFADQSIINMLDIEVVKGDPAKQLTEPNTVMISQRIADRYFPTDNPIEQEIELAIRNRIFKTHISGVFGNLPSSSSMQADFIGNMEDAFTLTYDLTYTLGFKKEKEVFNYHETWARNEFITFLQLIPNSPVKSVEEKCSAICLQHREENVDGGIHLQPVSDMYLHSEELESRHMFLTNQLDSLKIFMGIGILILLVAIINFILISNADNNLSINEIACRKVNGASKKQIIFNSLFKSVMVAFISLVPALLFVWGMIPVFNILFEKDLHLSLFLHWQYILVLIMVTLVTGISAGLYLGLYISGVNPSSLFQKNSVPHGRRRNFRGSLVVVQFIVFILLAGSFLLMLKQYNFSLHKDIGMNTKDILAFDINDDILAKNIDLIRSRALTNPHIIDCVPTSFTSPPSDNTLIFSFLDKKTGEEGILEAIVIGKGIIEMMDIKVLDGRSFDEHDKGFGEKFIINEAAAKKYDVRAGEILFGFDIIGIVNNFHFHSLHKPVEPIFIAAQAENFHYMLVKTNGKNKEAGEYIRQLCRELSPGFYIDYELLDDRIARFYKKEEKQMGTIGFFAAIALGLSLMGLVGFVSLNLLKRKKEIGIRKINGATLQGILRMINTQYVLWIIIAFIVACPVTYLAMNKWLEGFAYKTEMSWWVFGLSGLGALIVALVTVSIQSWKTAKKNPVEALRYE